MKKPYHVTIDYFVIIENDKGWYQRKHIQQSMQRFKELGITRVYWLHNDDSMLPDRLAGESGSLTKAVVDAGHALGLEVYALFKPFEMGLCFAVPHNFPLDKTITTISSQAGIHPFMEKFVVDHPEMRMKKRSLDNTNRKPAMVKLIKRDAEITPLNDRNLEIWYSSINGSFSKYEGTYDFNDGIETRDNQSCRVLTFSSLEFPPDTNYIMVRCVKPSKNPDFINKHNQIMEIYDQHGKIMTSAHDEGLVRIDTESGWGCTTLLRTLRCLGLCKHNDENRYINCIPENYGETPENAFYNFFDDFFTDNGERALDGKVSLGVKDGIIVHSLVEKEYLLGGLNPCYPEVRQHWLNRIQDCIDAGVDGVDIRLCNHSTWTLSGEEYGFNEPAVKAFQEKYGINVLTEEFDMLQWKKFLHDYWMIFLREARSLVKSHNVALQLHVPAYISKNITSRINNLLNNIDWDWQRWITEPDLCDTIHLKWPHLDMAFTESVARFAKSHGKDVSFSLRLQYIRMDGRENPTLKERLEWAQKNDDIDSIVFYEMVCFTQLDKAKDEVVVLPAMKELLDTLGVNSSAHTGCILKSQDCPGK